MKLAIQERLLPGNTTNERLQHARQFGFDGVEFQADRLTAQVPDIVEALVRTEMQASAVYVGGTHLLHPDYAQREQAIVTIRQAIADTLDLGAQGIIVVTHLPTTPRLPDLHPYRSSIELEIELLVTQLRATLCDLAYAMGAEIYLAPQNRYETHLLRRLEHAAVVLQKNNNHPHAKIAANLFHMALEEDDLLAALRDHVTQIGYIQVADHNHRLPGHGMTDFADVIAVLHEAGYDGWLTIACEPDHELIRGLPACVSMLRQHIGK